MNKSPECTRGCEGDIIAPENMGTVRCRRCRAEAIRVGNYPKIRTENIFPPIPDRQFDWSAVFEDYEPGCPIGYGPTEQAAIDDLIEQYDLDNGQFGVGA